MNQQSALRKIRSLRHTVYEQSACGFKARVDFVSLTYQYGLQDTVRDGDSSLNRPFDTCFESGDAELVGAEVVRNARNGGFIEAIGADFAPASLKRWSEMLDARGVLF